MDKAKGKAKEATGKLTGDEEMEREGKRDHAEGTLKEKAGDAIDSVRDGAEKLADKVRGKRH